MKTFIIALVAVLASMPVMTQEKSVETAKPRFEEAARFKADFARQGIAVDANHFYAVTDEDIAKHDKKTGKLVGEWKGEKDGPIIHLDSAAIVDGKIYAGHSNYPLEPMTSSVEIWDAATMQHFGSHSFGIMWGSNTWIDRHDGAWWVTFANFSLMFRDNHSAAERNVYALLDACSRYLWFTVSSIFSEMKFITHSWADADLSAQLVRRF